MGGVRNTIAKTILSQYNRFLKYNRVRFYESNFKRLLDDLPTLIYIFLFNLLNTKIVFFLSRVLFDV